MNKLSIYGSLSIDLKFVAHIFPKWLVFANYVSLPNVLPPTGQFFYMAHWALPKNVDTRQSETKATYFVRLGCLKMDIGHCLDTTMVTCPGTCKIGISSSRCKTTQDNVTVQLSPLLSWIRCAGKTSKKIPGIWLNFRPFSDPAPKMLKRTGEGADLEAVPGGFSLTRQYSLRTDGPKEGPKIEPLVSRFE